MAGKGIGLGKCSTHGEYYLDADDSPCPSCEDTETSEILLEIVRVVMADDSLREKVLSELDVTDETVLEALAECE